MLPTPAPPHKREAHRQGQPGTFVQGSTRQHLECTSRCTQHGQTPRTLDAREHTLGDPSTRRPEGLKEALLAEARMGALPAVLLVICTGPQVTTRPAGDLNRAPLCIALQRRAYLRKQEGPWQASGSLSQCFTPPKAPRNGILC